MHKFWRRLRSKHLKQDISREPAPEILVIAPTNEWGPQDDFDTEIKREDDAFMIEYEDAEDDSPSPQMLKTAEPQTMTVDYPSTETANGDTTAVTYSDAVPYSYKEDITTVSNLEAGSGSAKRSYLAIMPTTIQIIDDKTALFVWHAVFHPAISRRFSSIIITCKFTKPISRVLGKTSSEVQVMTYAPRKAFGASSKEQKSITWGLELPISIPAGPVSIGATPSGSQSLSKEVEHAFTITGSARGSPYRNTCVWTVEENDSTERGVPSELQLAALVQHSGPVQVEVDISGWTAGGYLPTHHLRPKTDAAGRRKIIDPGKYNGPLQEFKFGEKPMDGCVKLLSEWTGEVDGSMLAFEQAIVRP